MKGKRIDSETRAKIVIWKLNNPEVSTRDIAEEEWVGKSTVARVLEDDLGQVGTSTKWKELIDINLEIINAGKEIILQEVQRLNKEWGIKVATVSDIKSLSSTLEDAFKQNQLLTWGATENIKGIWDILSEIQGLKSKSE